MLYAGDSAYSPLICIGRDVRVGSSARITCLCISPAGRIAMVEPDPVQAGEDDVSFLSRMQTCIGALRTWDHEDIDGVAADYFYDTTGQASRGIDIMARNGYLTLAASQEFSVNLDAGLKQHDILVIVSAASGEVQMRRDSFACGAVENSGILYSIIDEEIGRQFISKKEQ